MNKAILIGSIVVIFIVVIVIIFVSRKKEKYSGNNTPASVLTADSNGNINASNSISVSSIDVGGISLNGNYGNLGAVMTATASGNNVWTNGFMRYIGMYQYTHTAQNVNPGNAIISVDITNLNPGKPLVVHLDTPAWLHSDDANFSFQAQIGSNKSNTFNVYLDNSRGWVGCNFLLNSDPSGTSAQTLEIMNISSSAIFWAYQGVSASISVYEIE